MNLLLCTTSIVLASATGTRLCAALPQVSHTVGGAAAGDILGLEIFFLFLHPAVIHGLRPGGFLWQFRRSTLRLKAQQFRAGEAVQATIGHVSGNVFDVIGVQPEASPAALLSLRDGVAYDPYDHEPTLADGLAGGFGAIPFAVARDLIGDVLLASEADMRRAIYFLVDREQLVVEASGAIAIAPLLNGSLDVADRTLVCVLSGGNLETTLLRDILVEFTN